MLYVDTSALVPALIREGRSSAVVRTLAARRGAIVISPWVVAETHSAIALKMRTGAASAKEAKAARAKLARLAGVYQSEPVTTADFERASALIVALRSPLRAGDALHLALCERIGADLLTFDAQMHAAAHEAGISVA